MNTINLIEVLNLTQAANNPMPYADTFQTKLFTSNDNVLNLGVTDMRDPDNAIAMVHMSTAGAEMISTFGPFNVEVIEGETSFDNINNTEWFKTMMANLPERTAMTTIVFKDIPTPEGDLGDMIAVCIATADGGFYAMTELRYDVAITAETLDYFLSGKYAEVHAEEQRKALFEKLDTNPELAEDFDKFFENDSTKKITSYVVDNHPEVVAMEEKRAAAWMH